MSEISKSIVPKAALATLAATCALALPVPAQAANVALGVSVGVPVASSYVAPAGYVQVGGRWGGYGGHRGHYRGGGWGVGYGLGLGLVLASPWILQPQPSVVVIEQPALPPVAIAAPPSRPEPVVYPRNGQSAQQQEGDRQECNRWATTQPAAMADASVFLRAVEACMDARGYTMK